MNEKHVNKEMVYVMLSFFIAGLEATGLTSNTSVSIQLAKHGSCIRIGHNHALLKQPCSTAVLYPCMTQDEIRSIAAGVHSELLPQKQGKIARFFSSLIG